jgi:AcrR family transcriptional regulator
MFWKEGNVLLNTGEKIIQSSLVLFAGKGFEATSIRDIAQEAGINSSTLYYYIKNKEDFLASIMEHVMERLIKNSEKILSIVDTPEHKISVLVQHHVLIHGSHKLSSVVTDYEFRSLHGENKTKIKNLRKKYELMWYEIIETGIKEGIFVNVESSKLATFALLEMCTGVVHWYSPKGRITLEEICDKYADMALKLLGAVRDRRLLSIDDLVLPDPKEFINLELPNYIDYREVLKN